MMPPQLCINWHHHAKPWSMKGIGKGERERPTRWANPDHPLHTSQLTTWIPPLVHFHSPTWFLVPKTENPHILFKSKPLGLGFGFWLQKPAPPSRVSGSHPHHTKPSIPHPNWVPSTRKHPPPMFRWPKPSPGSSVLGFWPQPVPPRASPNGTPPLPQTQCTPPQPGPLYAKRAPPAFRLPKPSPSS